MTIYRDQATVRIAADRIASQLIVELKAGAIQKIGIEEIKQKVLLEEQPLRTDFHNQTDLEEMTCRYIVKKVK